MKLLKHFVLSALLMMAAIGANAQVGFSSWLYNADAAQGVSLVYFLGPGSIYYSPSAQGPNFFNDGNFNYTYSYYTIPTSGLYHIDAAMFVAVTSTAAPSQNVGIFLASCPSTGCQFECNGSPIATGGYVFLGNGKVGNVNPNYSLPLSYTGYFNAGTHVSLCTAYWAYVGLYENACGNGSCYLDIHPVQ